MLHIQAVWFEAFPLVESLFGGLRRERTGTPKLQASNAALSKTRTSGTGRMAVASPIRWRSCVSSLHLIYYSPLHLRAIAVEKTTTPGERIWRSSVGDQSPRSCQQQRNVLL